MAIPTLNTAYVKTPAGLMRIVEAGVAICGIISLEEGAYCISDVGRYAFYRFVVIAALLEAIAIFIVLLFRLDQHQALKVLPVVLLINDSLFILFYFIASNLMMISIGNCGFRLPARVAASLFSIAGTIVMTGLSYTDYLWVNGEPPTTPETPQKPAIPQLPFQHTSTATP